MREATSRLERLFHRPTLRLLSCLSLLSHHHSTAKYHNVAQIDIPNRVDHKVVRSSAAKIIEKASQSRIRHRVTGQWLGENGAETAQQKATCRERERRKSTGGKKECDRDEDGETSRWKVEGRVRKKCRWVQRFARKCPRPERKKKKSPGQFE